MAANLTRQPFIRSSVTVLVSKEEQEDDYTLNSFHSNIAFAIRTFHNVPYDCIAKVKT